MKFVLSVSINDDDGVPTCEELGAVLRRASEEVIATGKGIPRVADCGERGEPKPIRADGRIVGSWRIE